MSFSRPTRTELARHEAGHAYAYASLNMGDEPEELGLARDGACWRGWCLRKTMLHAGEGSFADQPWNIRRYLIWQAEAEILVAVAGPLAECRYRGKSAAAGLLFMSVNAERFLDVNFGDRDGDFTRIRTMMSHLDPDDPAAALRLLLATVGDTLSRNWPRINLLAVRLLKRGILSGDELCAHFEAHPAALMDWPLLPGDGR